MGLRRTRRRFLKEAAAGALAAGILAPLRLRGADPAAAPTWTSFRNGLANLGIAGSALPGELNLHWEFPTSDGTSSTPVIADGRAYLGALNGDLYCLELKTGKPAWTYKSVEKVEANSLAPGFAAPAALDAKHIYIGDDQGTFHAVDRQTGKAAWTVVTDDEIVGGAQVVGEKVLFGSHDGHLYCHEAAGGKQLWKAETHGPVNGAPCVSGTHTFTTGCDQPILRVFEIEKGEQTAELSLNSLLIASAAVKDEILYFGTDGGVVFALDWRKKQTLWQFSVPNRDQQIHSSPAITDELLVIGSRDKHIYCLLRQTGELKWSYQTRGKIDGSPVIAGDRVFIGSADRNLYALDLASGKELWKRNVKQSITGSAAVGEGRLVIGTDSTNGAILCFGG